MHWCAYHLQDEPDKNFRIKKNGKLDSWCIEGRNENSRKESKIKYAPIKEANAARPIPTTKICTECKVEKPLEDFPERSDRPGKRHAQCHKCRSTYVAKYNQKQRSNIARHKSQKRALIAKSTIGDKQTNDEYIAILQNDPCCYCGNLIDIEIDHIDPISPLSDVHGAHNWTNFTAVCSKCKKEKINNSLLDFLNKKDR